MATPLSTQGVKSFKQTIGGRPMLGKTSGCVRFPVRQWMSVENRQTLKLRLPASKKSTPKAKKASPVPTKKSDDSASSQASQKTQSIELFSKLKRGKTKGTFRSKETGKSGPRILSSIEQMKLLSKLEKAGLLSKVEKSGLSLSKVESLGLLSTAEDLGLLSAVYDRSTATKVYTLGFILLAAVPASVFLIPDSSPALVYGQYTLASVAALGGAAALTGASFLSKLQE